MWEPPLSFDSRLSVSGGGELGAWSCCFQIPGRSRGQLCAGVGDHESALGGESWEAEAFFCASSFPTMLCRVQQSENVGKRHPK